MEVITIAWDDTQTTADSITHVEWNAMVTAINAIDLQDVFDNDPAIVIADTDNKTFSITQNDTTNNPTALQLTNTGTGDCLNINMDGATGYSIEIDQDSNDAGDIYAIKVVCDNAGAGAGCGIDLSSFSVDEPEFKAVSDTITNAGTLSEQIAIDIGGTTYYLYAYTTGS